VLLGSSEEQAPGQPEAPWTPDHVGDMQVVRRSCRRTMGFAKLYDRETPNIVADLLNDRVVPSMTPMRRRSAVLDEFRSIAFRKQNWGSIDEPHGVQAFRRQ
jgi:hypothetical protein